MMKRTVFIVSALTLALYLIGCGKKEPAQEEAQGPMSMEALSMNETDANAPGIKPQALSNEPAFARTGQAAAAKLEPLPPAGPYKPAAQEIQSALRNAEFYAGPIDGKIGPLTKKAIESFQKANNLKADGKVGPKTWSALSTYLKAPAEVKSKKR